MARGVRVHGLRRPAHRAFAYYCLQTISMRSRLPILLACIGLMGCGQQAGAPASKGTAPVAPASTAITPTPAQTVSPWATLDAQELANRLKGADDQAVAHVFRELRNTDLPADYTPPTWLADAPDGFTARKTISAHHADLLKRMGNEGRIQVMRNEPALMREMLLAEKYAKVLDDRANAAPTE
jgi:hypothetical protein